jgi:HrpA-like RNA helicase
MATNIAQSSITFDDVAAVVDSCRVNVADFDAVKNLPSLGPQVCGHAACATVEHTHPFSQPILDVAF